MSDSDQSKIYGPILPPNLAAKNEAQPEDSSDDDGFYGPSLPASIATSNTSKPIIGPSLPPGITSGPESREKTDSDEEKNEAENDDDDEIIGPLPAGQMKTNHFAPKARTIKQSDNLAAKREKWMLEPGKAIGKTLQLKSVTKFQQKTSKEKPLTEEDKMEIKAKEEKDQKMDEFLKKYEKNNKRNISLLETHRQERKKNKNLKTEKTERKEFDRERDLCAPNMDKKTKKSLINQASETFGTRFSSGKFEKFL